MCACAILRTGAHTSPCTARTYLATRVLSTCLCARSCTFMRSICDVDHANSRSALLKAGQTLAKQLSAVIALQPPRPARAPIASPLSRLPPKAPAKGDAAAPAAAGGPAARPPKLAALAKDVQAILKDVLGGLVAEARAMRRAVRGGRLGREALAVADNIEEVLEQVGGPSWRTVGCAEAPARPCARCCCMGGVGAVAPCVAPTPRLRRSNRRHHRPAAGRPHWRWSARRSRLT
jgi:hypothetical protein